jgi:hypothetical protein
MIASGNLSERRGHDLPQELSAYIQGRVDVTISLHLPFPRRPVLHRTAVSPRNVCVSRKSGLCFVHNLRGTVRKAHTGSTSFATTPSDILIFFTVQWSLYINVNTEVATTVPDISGLPRT